MASQIPSALVQQLVAARREQRLLDVEGWAGTLKEAEEAYRVQDEVAAALGWFGDSVPTHWKSGGASRTAVLTHAPLAPAGVRSSPADFSDMHFNKRGIEAEIALRIGVEVTPQKAAALSADDAVSVVDAMAVSIEVVDSRWRDGAKEAPLLKLADSQVHGALAIGEWLPYVARDWSAQRCDITIGAAEPVQRIGTHPLGEPLWGVPGWLRHLTRHGRSVPAGTVITTGSWCGILPAQRGEAVSVRFEGIGAASLQL
jgi:2-keto-4-pentenoate hydratase